MKYEFKKETNIKFDTDYWVIVREALDSTFGVFKARVEDIDWNNEIVDFSCPAQRFRYVSCHFSDMEKYCFETEEQANETYKSMTPKDGMYRADGYSSSLRAY